MDNFTEQRRGEKEVELFSLNSTGHLEPGILHDMGDGDLANNLFDYIQFAQQLSLSPSMLSYLPLNI